MLFSCPPTARPLRSTATHRTTTCLRSALLPPRQSPRSAPLPPVPSHVPIPAQPRASTPATPLAPLSTLPTSRPLARRFRTSPTRSLRRQMSSRLSSRRHGQRLLGWNSRRLQLADSGSARARAQAATRSRRHQTWRCSRLRQVECPFRLWRGCVCSAFCWPTSSSKRRCRTIPHRRGSSI